MHTFRTILVAASIAWSLPLVACAAPVDSTVVSQLIPPAVFAPIPPPKPVQEGAKPAPKPGAEGTTPPPAPRTTQDERAIEAHVLLQEGEAAHNDGNLLDALHMYRQVLSITDKDPKPTIDRAAAEGAMAAIYADMNSFALARKYCKMSLNDIEKLEGPVNVDVGITLNNLGYIEEHLRADKSAETAYRQAISVLRACSDQDEDLMGVCQNNLGDLLFKHHRYTEAAQCYKQAYIYFKRFFGSDFPLTRMAMSKLTHARHHIRHTGK